MCDQCTPQKPVTMGTIVKLCQEVVNDGQCLAEVIASIQALDTDTIEGDAAMGPAQDEHRDCLNNINRSILKLRATLTNYR